ncbi:MAG TPA: hypothetical protein VF324_07345 [Methanobacterium sp.]
MTMKGMYVIENNPYTDFKELENRGLTHIFYSDSFLLNNFNTCKNNILELINEMHGTELKLYININAFKASDQASLVDPTNRDHRNKLKTALIQLLSDIPIIDGIMFEDFHWQMWSGYDVVQQGDILAEFAKEMVEAVHDVDESKKLSASMIWTSPAIELTAAELDYVMPRIYSSKSTGIPLSTAIKRVLEKIDADKMVVDLITYDSAVNLTPRSLSDIYNEISTVIKFNGANYCLYAYPWIPYGLGFPSEDYSFTEINVNLNLVSKHKIIPEKSSRIVTISFLDQNNNPLSEDLLATLVGEYKITDQSTGRVIKDFTKFIPDNSIYELLISSDENRIINPDVSQENHIITVSAIYGDGKKENEELLVTIQNLLGIN